MTVKLTPDERYEWLRKRIRKERYVDVLNRYFVDDYIEATGAAFRPVFWGANKCRRLARDLRELYLNGELRRHRVGLGCNWQPGFPKWVWSYCLKEEEE